MKLGELVTTTKGRTDAAQWNTVDSVGKPDQFDAIDAAQELRFYPGEAVESP